ncbi:polysaccharide deacetylase family protein [Ligilactobacillus sp. LYQ135]
MKKISNFFKRSWHFIFVVVCISIVVFIGISEHDAKIKQANVQKEISNGKLSKNELNKDGILVLCYHRVSESNKTLSARLTLNLSNNEQLHEYTASKQTLEKQILYLKKNNVKIISMEKAIQLVKKGKPMKHKYVVFTFDDVDRTIVDNVDPLFKKLGDIPYTIFIVTQNTGRYDNGTKLATWDELHQVLKNSNVTIGVHTNKMHYLINNKPALKYANNYNEFVKDYKKSQQIIQKHTGHKTPYFAYPYGEGTAKEQKYLAKQGMYTFSLDNGIITQDQDLTQPLPRTMVDKETWNDVVKKWVGNDEQ